MDRLPFKKLHEPRDGRILQVPPRFKNGGEAGFPLPSTGRGIEGEGWADPAAFPITSTWAFPPLTPALSPLRGEGDGSASRFYGGASTFTTVLLPRCAPNDRSAAGIKSQPRECSLASGSQRSHVP